jgi:hypothetical protein
VPYVHASTFSYASAFQTTTIPRKTAFDFVSILEGNRGGLTTNAEPGGAALPASPGSLRQVFPGASVEVVFERHREALHYLRANGLAAREVSAASFSADFAESFRRQRQAFLRSPLSGTLVMLWRSATSLTPHVGALAGQAAAQATIRRIKEGR